MDGGPARRAASDAAGIVARWLAAAPQVAGPEPAVALAHETRSHGGAALFRVAPRGGGAAMAAKLFNVPANAAAEFRMAREVAGCRARVARALRCDEGLGLLVSEWVEGETLAAVRHRGDVAALAQDAGRWLRRYHRDAPVPAAQEGRGVAGQAIERRRPPPFMEPAERGEFRRATEALAAEAHLVAEPSRPVRIHGDFHASNLLVTPAGLVAVDLLQGRAGSRFEDLARMTVWFDMAAATEEAGFDAAGARAAFLGGYGIHGDGPARRLAVAEGLELLRRWWMASRAVAAAPRRAAAARALLAQRGWLQSASASTAPHSAS